MSSSENFSTASVSMTYPSLLASSEYLCSVSFPASIRGFSFCASSPKICIASASRSVAFCTLPRASTTSKNTSPALFSSPLRPVTSTPKRLKAPCISSDPSLASRIAETRSFILSWTSSSSIPRAAEVYCSSCSCSTVRPVSCDMVFSCFAFSAVLVVAFARPVTIPAKTPTSAAPAAVAPSMFSVRVCKAGGRLIPALSAKSDKDTERFPVFSFALSSSSEVSFSSLFVFSS